MGFDLCGYHFEGTYISPYELKSNPGVYVIWCKTDVRWTILDVGESDNVNDRVNNHDRTDCWARNCSGAIFFSATYLSDLQERSNLEQTIRSSRNVACGER